MRRIAGTPRPFRRGGDSPELPRSSLSIARPPSLLDLTFSRPPARGAYGAATIRAEIAEDLLLDQCGDKLQTFLLGIEESLNDADLSPLGKDAFKRAIATELTAFLDGYVGGEVELPSSTLLHALVDYHRHRDIPGSAWIAFVRSVTADYTQFPGLVEPQLIEHAAGPFSRTDAWKKLSREVRTSMREEVEPNTSWTKQLEQPPPEEPAGRT